MCIRLIRTYNHPDCRHTIVRIIRCSTPVLAPRPGLPGAGTACLDALDECEEFYSSSAKCPDYCTGKPFHTVEEPVVRDDRPHTEAWDGDTETAYGASIAVYADRLFHLCLNLLQHINILNMPAHYPDGFLGTQDPQGRIRAKIMDYEDEDRGALWEEVVCKNQPSRHGCRYKISWLADDRFKIYAEQYTLFLRDRDDVLPTEATGGLDPNAVVEGRPIVEEDVECVRPGDTYDDLGREAFRPVQSCDCLQGEHPYMSNYATDLREEWAQQILEEGMRESQTLAAHSVLVPRPNGPGWQAGIDRVRRTLARGVWPPVTPLPTNEYECEQLFRVILTHDAVRADIRPWRGIEDRTNAKFLADKAHIVSEQQAEGSTARNIDLYKTSRRECMRRYDMLRLRTRQRSPLWRTDSVVIKHRQHLLPFFFLILSIDSGLSDNRARDILDYCGRLIQETPNISYGREWLNRALGPWDVLERTMWIMDNYRDHLRTRWLFEGWIAADITGLDTGEAGSLQWYADTEEAWSETYHKDLRYAWAALTNLQMATPQDYDGDETDDACFLDDSMWKYHTWPPRGGARPSEEVISLAEFAVAPKSCAMPHWHGHRCLVKWSRKNAYSTDGKEPSCTACRTPLVLPPEDLMEDTTILPSPVYATFPLQPT